MFTTKYYSSTATFESNLHLLTVALLAEKQLGGHTDTYIYTFL